MPSNNSRQSRPTPGGNVDISASTPELTRVREALSAAVEIAQDRIGEAGYLLDCCDPINTDTPDDPDEMRSAVDLIGEAVSELLLAVGAADLDRHLAADEQGHALAVSLVTTPQSQPQPQGDGVAR